MNFRPLGRSGLRVSEISLGSWTTYGGSISSADSKPLIRRAFELGINLFDTADVYVKGAAELALGEAVRELPRGEIVVATKCMGRVGEGRSAAGSRKHMFDALDAKLEAAWPRLRGPLPVPRARPRDADTRNHLRAFEDLVRSGRVRYVGFSNFDERIRGWPSKRWRSRSASAGSRSTHRSRDITCSTGTSSRDTPSSASGTASA